MKRILTCSSARIFSHATVARWCFFNAATKQETSSPVKGVLRRILACRVWTLIPASRANADKFRMDDKSTD